MSEMEQWRDERPVFYAGVLCEEFYQEAPQRFGLACVVEDCSECSCKTVVVRDLFLKALMLCVEHEAPHEQTRPFQVLCPSCFAKATEANSELIEMGFVNPEAYGVAAMIRYLAEQN